MFTRNRYKRTLLGRLSDYLFDELLEKYGVFGMIPGLVLFLVLALAMALTCAHFSQRPRHAIYILQEACSVGQYLHCVNHDGQKQNVCYCVKE